MLALQFILILDKIFFQINLFFIIFFYFSAYDQFISVGLMPIPGFLIVSIFAVIVCPLFIFTFEIKLGLCTLLISISCLAKGFTELPKNVPPL